MSSEQKVAIITGASRGIGAGAVQAFRRLGYAVVANSQHITSSADPSVLTVPGDIADPETGGRLVDRALEHFGQVDQYAACGVRVNTVSPGIIRTPMPRPHQSRRPAQGSTGIPRPRSPEALSSHAEETHDTLAAPHPAGRMGDVGDIVEAIGYLETAEFVTGEILHVDGGQSAGH